MTDRSSPSARAAAPAGDELVVRRRAVLERFFAKRVRDPSEIDDLVQDVFVHIARRAQGRAIENPDGYLFQVAANLLRDRARQRTSRRVGLHEPFEDGVHARETISPERALIGKEAVADLLTALDALPERTRDVFLLHRYDGLKHAEIAKRFDITESAVWKHMAKAVAHLDQWMKRGRP